MSDLPRRPISIWITQILVLLVGIPISIVVIFATLRDAMWVASGDVTFWMVLALILSAILRIGFVLLFVFAFWGLVRRRRYGRWLAVGVMLILVAFSIAGQFLRPSGPLEYYEYENSAQLMGGVFASLIIYGLVGLLLYHLIFSDSVSDFFNAQADDVLEPPPPPQIYLEGAAVAPERDRSE